MSREKYDLGVFLNCPFDREFKPLFEAMVFTVLDCGYKPRCAREVDDSGIVRIDKLVRLMGESRFGIHDLSRKTLEAHNQLPRFNMPFELGVFLGAKYFGDRLQKDKNCLILDSQPYDFQEFISDIAGQDPVYHGDQPETIIRLIRDWLNTATPNRVIPGGQKIFERFNQFKEDLPLLCRKEHLKVSEMTYVDYTDFASMWLIENALVRGFEK